MGDASNKPIVISDRLGKPECTESAPNLVGQCDKLFKVDAGEVAERLKAAVC